MCVCVCGGGGGGGGRRGRGSLTHFYYNSFYCPFSYIRGIWLAFIIISLFVVIFELNANSVDPYRRRILLLPGREVIQLFSCSTELSIKFSLLVNMKMPTVIGIFMFNSRYENANNCWHFHIY